MAWPTTVLAGSEGRFDVVAETSQPVPERQLVVAEQADSATTIDAARVERLAAAAESDDAADSVALVTTGSFSVEARSAAAASDVKLISGDHLVGLLDADDVAGLDAVGRSHAAD